MHLIIYIIVAWFVCALVMARGAMCLMRNDAMSSLERRCAALGLATCAAVAGLAWPLAIAAYTIYVTSSWIKSRPGERRSPLHSTPCARPGERRSPSIGDDRSPPSRARCVFRWAKPKGRP